MDMNENKPNAQCRVRPTGRRMGGRYRLVLRREIAEDKVSHPWIGSVSEVCFKSAKVIA